MIKKIAGIIFAALFVCAVNVVAVETVISAIVDSDIGAFKDAFDGFRHTIKQDKPDVTIAEYFSDKIDPSTIMSDLAKDNSAVVLVMGSKATKIASVSIQGKDVIFCMIFNPKEFTGSNATGVSLDIPPETKLERLKEILPEVKRIGVLYSDKTQDRYAELNSAAGKLGFTVIGKQISGDSDFAGALQDLAGKIDCFMMLLDSKIFFTQTTRLLLLEGLKNKYPVIGLSAFYSKAGAPLSFDCDYKDIGAQAGKIAERVLEGEKVSEIKIQRPRKVTYSINKTAADKIGLNFAPGATDKATEVFNQ